MIKHRHHKIPRHVGGSDDESNIEILTIEEHSLAHKALYEEFGRQEDYIAWKALSGQIGKEEIIEAKQKLGREKGGETNRISGHMSMLGKTMPLEDRLKNISKGIEKQRKEQTGCFFNEKLHREVTILGGKAQGKINAETGHCSRISKQYWKDVKSGKKVRKKKRFINNGSICKKIPIDESIPEGFTYGMLRHK